MPEKELFTIRQVSVTIPQCDMPGRPLKRVQCRECGDWVQDGREVEKDGRTLCRSCASGRYYEPL